MSETYVPLHVHSVYSIRDAIAKIDEMVEKAVELGMPALALTDHGTLSGILDFYKKCKKQGIKPILGSEVYVSTRGRNDKVKGIDKYYHLVLLATNETGWSNLTKLVSEGYHAANFYHKPRVDRELLRKYNEGIIALSACWAGHLIQSILREAEVSIDFDEDLNKNEVASQVEDHPEGCRCLECHPSNYYETPEQVIAWHKDVFGDRYYIELQNHNTEIEAELNRRLLQLGQQTNTKVVATGDSHFVEPEDKKAHDILLAIRGNMSIHDEKMNNLSYPGDGYHMQTYTEMLNRFPDNPEVLANTLEVAERCNVEFHLGDFKLPHVVDVKEEDEVFRAKVMDGLKKRFGEDIPEHIISRAEEEMLVITRMCFSSYFLMVSDFTKWAKAHDIPIGPGRGSAAGSIVSYALDITNVDSLEYDLSFARFLNRGRCSIPQIDFPEFPYADFKEPKNEAA